MMSERPSRERDRRFVELASELLALSITPEARALAKAVIDAKGAKARREAVQSFERALCSP